MTLSKDRDWGIPISIFHFAFLGEALYRLPRSSNRINSIVPRFVGHNLVLEALHIGPGVTYVRTPNGER